MFNDVALNKIEYTRNKKNNLWVAHAHHVITDKHVYATGRTMDLLKRNIIQNIAKHGLNPRTFVWDEHPVDNIYMAGASKLFITRHMKADEKVEKDMKKNKSLREAKCTHKEQEVFIKEVDGMIIVYAVKEIARYKKSDTVL